MQQQRDLLQNNKNVSYVIEVTRILSNFRGHIECASFHAMGIFDDINDTAWYTSSFIKYVVDHFAPAKNKIVSSRSVRNMAPNKLKNMENLTERKPNTSETKLLKFSQALCVNILNLLKTS